MQVLEAGPNKYLLLELDPESIVSIARQAGFDVKVDDQSRVVSLELAAQDRQAPLLSFCLMQPTRGILGGFRAASSMWTGSPEVFYRRRCGLRISGTRADARYRMPSGCKLRKSCRGAFECRDANP